MPTTGCTVIALFLCISKFNIPFKCKMVPDGDIVSVVRLSLEIAPSAVILTTGPMLVVVKSTSPVIPKPVDHIYRRVLLC